MSFFGDVGNRFELYSSLAKKYIVSIMPWEAKGNNFKVSRYLSEPSKPKNRASIEETVPLLKAKGIPFRLKEIVNDFGQPLESVQDAIEFVSHYYKLKSTEMIERYLSENLRKKGAGYYLPNIKKSGVLVIDLQPLNLK